MLLANAASMLRTRKRQLIRQSDQMYIHYAATYNATHAYARFP